MKLFQSIVLRIVPLAVLMVGLSALCQNAAPAHRDVVIKNAVVMTVTHGNIKNGSIYIKDGKIVYDLNGMESLPWTAPEGDISNDKRWTSWPRPKPRPDDGVKLH